MPKAVSARVCVRGCVCVHALYLSILAPAYMKTYNCEKKHTHTHTIAISSF